MAKAQRKKTATAQTLMEDLREELASLAGALAAHLKRTHRLGKVLIPGPLPQPQKSVSPGEQPKRQATQQAVAGQPSSSLQPHSAPQKRGAAQGREHRRPAPKRPAPGIRPPRQSSSADTTASDRDTGDVTKQLAAIDIPGALGIAKIKAILGNCRRCPLAESRRHIVFGQGDPSAEVMFIGEAPSAQEDRQGQPFVGPAGELLAKMLKAMGLSRKRVYVANILKCRPPSNRDPLPEEISVCLPFLEAQIRAIQPRIIVALGRIAAQTLLDSQASLSSLRGAFHDYKGIAVMPTYHPAYLLRRPEGKRAAWHDLQLVMREMDRLGLERDRSLR